MKQKTKDDPWITCSRCYGEGLTDDNLLLSGRPGVQRYCKGKCSKCYGSGKIRKSNA